MSTTTGAKAAAKLVGEDVEDLVLQDVDALHPTDDPDAHHDAVVDGLLTPTDRLPFGSICLLEDGTPVEIKACKQSTSNGVGDVPGRWFFKGRDDGQHAHLLEQAGAYLLVVYSDVDDDDRELVELLVLPATIVDELLADAWYDSGRREGAVAKLHWTNILDDNRGETA